MSFSLNNIPGIQVGHATEIDALTGCTLVVFPQGAIAAQVTCGVASGSRELPALTPRHLVERIHGICLAGGSAFGLAAASGAMEVLESAGIGHETSYGKVPIVAGAVVYDLNLGRADVRPDLEMGRKAAVQALNNSAPCSGNVGAGAGVCAGKLLGVACATKTGLGNAGIQTEDGLIVGALVVANPVGDILRPGTSAIIAGARKAPDSHQLVGTANIIRAGARCQPLAHNTTLVVVGTNALLSRVEAAWVANQVAVALARQIDPPFTRHDGDVVFCVAVGDLQTDLHRVGVFCRDAVTLALVDACESATPAGGLPNFEALSQPMDILPGH